MTMIGSEWNYGDLVAWSRDGQEQWTQVHRAFRSGFTFCSLAIPTQGATVGRGKPSLKKCGRCDRMYVQSRKYYSDEARVAAKRT